MLFLRAYFPFFQESGPNQTGCAKPSRNVDNIHGPPRSTWNAEQRTYQSRLSVDETLYEPVVIVGRH